MIAPRASSSVAMQPLEVGFSGFFAKESGWPR